jgi:hypothetical protein
MTCNGIARVRRVPELHDTKITSDPRAFRHSKQYRLSFATQETVDKLLALAVQRMSAVLAVTAAASRLGEGLQWAGRVLIAGYGTRLCKVRFLRFAAAGTGTSQQNYKLEVLNLRTSCSRLTQFPQVRRDGRVED